MSSRLLRTIALLVALALIGAACGGDDGPSPFGANANANGDSSQLEDALNGLDLENQDPGSAGDLLGDLDLENLDLGDLDLSEIPGFSDECGAVVEIMAAMAGAFLGGGETFLETVADKLDEVPGNMRDDVEVLANGFAAYSEALQDAGIDFSDPQALFELDEDDQAKLDEVGALLETDDFTAAGERLSALAESECTG